ncbi:hypothetical protein [Rhodococcus sp. SJ-2]
MNEPRSLTELVDLAMEKQNVRSGRALARVADEQGHQITYTTINQIRSRSYRSTPEEDTLRTLAELAGIPHDVAYRAANLRTPGRPFVEDLPPGVDYLAPHERQAVIELLRVMVSQRRQLDDVNDADSTAPNPGLRLVDDETLAAKKGKSRAHRMADQETLDYGDE